MFGVTFFPLLGIFYIHIAFISIRMNMQKMRAKFVENIFDVTRLLFIKFQPTRPQSKLSHVIFLGSIKAPRLC
jgi:hypothetical protein